MEAFTRMNIEDRSGRSLPEVTVTVDETEAVSLLEGLSDVVQGVKDHLHFAQLGGPQLVVRKGPTDDDPLGRQMDWWVGPLVLLGIVLVVVGTVTIARWVAGLL
jgi:hypothetical protein